ncbi:Os02g0624350, partial [Oryza sativa Japonica Group]
VVVARRRRGTARAERIAAAHLHPGVGAVHRHCQRLRPEAVVDLELLLRGETVRGVVIRGGGHRVRVLLGGGGRRRRGRERLLRRHRHGGRNVDRHRHRRSLLGRLSLGRGGFPAGRRLRLQPLLEVSVPHILDLVVRPPRQPRCNRGPS